MPTVVELSDPYANFLHTPASPGDPDTCEVCLTFTEGGWPACYSCNHQPRAADAVLAISFSTHMGQLHAALRGYKEGRASSRRFTLELAAVLWRFLDRHERCLALRASSRGFALVTTVPSSDAERDARHPLPTIVGDLVKPTSERYEQLLRRSDKPVDPRAFDAEKYEPTRKLTGDDVLLIDDTWTTGANAQSAAQTLKSAGAGAVGVLVIGRHIREEYGDNAKRLKALPRFSWDACAFE